MNNGETRSKANNEETPFVQMAEDVEGFDPQRQFINKWNGSTKMELKSLAEAPIDVDKLSTIQVNDGLDNQEWVQHFVRPYKLGIHASAASIGVLAEQFVEDKDEKGREGCGIDASIRGTIKLFSEIFGIKKPIRMELISPDDEDSQRYLGAYKPGTDAIWFNFDKVNKVHQDNAEETAKEMISIIAHELWHAHQCEVLNDAPTLRRAIYETNHEQYIEGKDDYHGYRNQLIEDEAYEMGNAASEVVELFSRYKEAFLNNSPACAETQGQAMQMLREKEQKFAELNL